MCRPGPNLFTFSQRIMCSNISEIEYPGHFAAEVGVDEIEDLIFCLS